MVKKRGFDRTQRVADLIQKTLGRVLLQDMPDRRFQFVTVISATVSRDLGYSTVYVSILSDDAETIKETVADLNRHAKHLRYQVAQEVDLRVMPELRFVYDESTANGFRISSLLNAALKKEQK